MTATRPRTLALSLAALSVLSFTAATADDWPQWRGPQRDGKSAETGLLSSWPEAGPPRLWSSPGFGSGFSSLAVAKGHIYTLGDLADGQYVIAAREKDGGIAWKTRLGALHEDEFAGPRSTPAVAGDRVYALGTSGDLVCLQAADGKEVWRRNIMKEYGARPPHWRVSESPLLDGDRLVVTPASSEALMVALDPATGKELWRTPGASLGNKGKDEPGYASAVVSTAAGVRQYINLVGRGAIGVEAEKGRLLWSYNKVANDVANIPTPLVSGDLVFVSTGYGTGAALLQISGGNEQVWATEKYFLAASTFQNHHGNMVLDKGVVYAGHGHNRGNPIALQMDTGKILWGPASNAGKGSAAVTWADGRLYMRYQDGRMVLVDAVPASYQERGSFMIPDVTTHSWSHPVIANGVLLLREQDRIHAYDIKAK